MQWKNNFSELNLVFNEPVTFSLHEDDNTLLPKYEFAMRIPTVCEVYTDTNLMTIAGLFNADIEDLQQQFPMIQNLGTHFGLFNALLIISNKNNKLRAYIDKLILVFQKLNIPLSIAENGIQYELGGYPVEYSVFSEIQKVLMVCMGLKKASDYAIDDPRYAEMQKKINRIKQKGKNAKEVGQGNLFESIVTLTYEFGFTINEVKNMNIFQMNTYLGYVGKSINYKVSLIAAGNGLSKKVKYITHKGK